MASILGLASAKGDRAAVGIGLLQVLTHTADDSSLPRVLEATG
jgi:hypothetical protein